eukprot:8912594-Pyramimonas_sp.AAC.1
MGEIDTCGVLPAASFGSSVVGMSLGELQVAQRARLAILGDPMWRPSVAPALQWASIVGLALTTPSVS